MRLSWPSLTFLSGGGAMIAWGAVKGDFETIAEGVIVGIIGVIWEALDRRGIGGAVVLRWLRGKTASRRRLLLGGLAVLFAPFTIEALRGALPPGLLLVTLGFVAAAPIIAAPFLLGYQVAARRAAAAETWPTVTGEVINSFMEQHTSDWPAPIVIYRYAVDGRSYRGHRVRFGGTGGMNPAAAQQVLAEHPEGSEVPVYYNPKRPGQSVLRPEGLGANKGLLWAAAICGGACMLAPLAMAVLVFLEYVDRLFAAVVGHRLLA